MLIDKTYFIGDINIPNTHILAISENVDWFIEKYEDDFLKKLMGYAFFKIFIDGISQTTVEQRWNDLLFGVEYTSNGILKKWTGLIEAFGSTISIDYTSSIDVVVDRGQTYDPVSGTNSVQLPPQLISKQVAVELRGIGQLRPDEYVISGSTFTFNYGKTFQTGETLFYHIFNYNVIITPGIQVKKSAIANYVYWFWQKDQFTQTVGIGEVKAKAENAVITSPFIKMIRTWNEVSDTVCEFFEFIEANKSVYPEWTGDSRAFAANYFKKVNLMNV